ncbi:hydrolase [Neptunomonas sp.]|uniref:hydrolase n=1 Tax=Neptunomonas sp. TaxID=1971898 RepID=UPI0025D95E98|nr:hydrolase [Neptunomonas sp.]
MSRLFLPPWWAKNPHVQTILPVFTKVESPALSRQRLELNDGDFIDLDWTGDPYSASSIVVILHGLEGSSDSHYVRRLLRDCDRLGLCAVVHHHRGCSGEANRLARSYHSGDTQDISHTLQYLQESFPQATLCAVGYSLGGNVLIKYLGELQGNSAIDRAVVVSAPLQLSACAKRLEKGFSTLYQWHLVKQLRQKLTDKFTDRTIVNQVSITLKQVSTLKTFYQFDHQVTAPLHGFKGVDDYYAKASGFGYLAKIKQPTLVIHAADDPFMNADVIPSAHQCSTGVTYELHQHGGHVGFIDGGSPLKPRFYLEQRIIQFLMSIS